MSLMTLSLAFFLLTLVLVAVLACFLRRRVADARRAARKPAEDVTPPALKEEE